MRRLLGIVLLVSLATTCTAQKKKKPELPKAVLVAQFVYVTGWHGDQFDMRTPPEERVAIARVISAIDQWHRYHVVNSPGQADLMLVVKSGNIGLRRMGPGIGGVDTPPISVGTPPPSTAGQMGGPFGGAEVGSTADDMLFLSMNASDRPDEASSIWRRSARNGFSGSVPLVGALKKSVEESEKALDDPKKP